MIGRDHKTKCIKVRARLTIRYGSICLGRRLVRKVW